MVFFAQREFSVYRWSIFLAIATCLLHGNTLDAEFVWDDRAAILKNRDLLPSTPWVDLLGHDFWGQNISLA